MSKDEALKMCLEYIETDAHERKYVRHAIKEALAQPEPPPECKTEEEKTAFAFGWWKALETQRMAQPDYRAVKTYHENKPVYVSQPEQEPAGTLNISRFKGHLVNHDFDYFGELPNGTYALYTTPPNPQPEQKPVACKHQQQCLNGLQCLCTTPPKRPWGNLGFP